MADLRDRLVSAGNFEKGRRAILSRLPARPKKFSSVLCLHMVWRVAVAIEGIPPGVGQHWLGPL